MTNCHNTYNTTHTNNGTIHNHITLNFGSESTGHITEEQMNNWVQLLRGSGIMKYLEAVHFNPEVKQNHNIKLDGGSHKIMKVFHNDTWVRRAATEVTELLIASGRGSLLDHYLQSGPIQEADRDTRTIYTDLLNTTAQDQPNIYYKIAKQILCKIIDLTEAMLREEDLS